MLAEDPFYTIRIARTCVFPMPEVSPYAVVADTGVDVGGAD